MCDTGATHHSCNSKEGAINERPARSSTLGHAGNAVKEESKIDLKGQFMTDDGELGITATLTEVSVNRKYNFNLFSLTRLLARGWHIARGDASSIVIEDKDGNRIVFDIVIRTARGAIYATRFIRETSEVSAVGTEAGTVMNIYKAHALLGHSKEESVRQTAKHLGWVITRGTMRPKPCEECAKSKAKQKALGNGKKKTSDTSELKPGDMIYLDLSKVTAAKSNGSNEDIPRKHCEIMVDKSTGKKWINFTKTKDGMVEPTCEWMSKMKAIGVPIRAIRMDPGGENIKLKKKLESADWQSLQPVDVQVTSRDTPQHNSRAEVSFPHIAGLARANMNAAFIPDGMRASLVSEAMRYSVQVDCLVMVELNGELKTREEHVLGQQNQEAGHLIPTELGMAVEFMFRIGGRADSNYAADTDDRRSVSGGRTFLNESPVIVRSNTQRTVSLSVTEAEQNAGVMVAQDMLYLMQTMNAVGLKVELPMVLEMDNIGAVHQGI